MDQNGRKKLMLLFMLKISIFFVVQVENIEKILHYVSNCILMDKWTI
jgi:hypothetical protein